MEIDRIIKKCSKVNNINNSISDPKILSNLISLSDPNDEDICVDLETLYNTVYVKENSYGSSNEYTIPPSLDDQPYDVFANRKSKREHMNDYHSDDPDYTIILLLLSSFALIVCMIIIMIYKNTGSI